MAKRFYGKVKVSYTKRNANFGLAYVFNNVVENLPFKR